MATNILTLPLLAVTSETGSNEDWLDGFQFLNADASPIDLTGITFDMMVRQNATSPRALIIASTNDSVLGVPANGQIVSGGTTGVLALAIQYPVMATLGAGNYVFDIIARADGNDRRVVVGTLVLDPGVTR